MFKIVRTAKQIFSAARNLGQKASVSINSGLKYCSQSKGYIEDVADEFYFESFKEILPKQSVTDQFKATAPIFQETNKLGSIGSHKILDSAEIRKLIYARFADKIVAKSQNAEESKNLETESHDTKDYKEACSTYNITEEFKIFKEQGYDFKSVVNLIEQKKAAVSNKYELEVGSNVSSSSLIDRMKKLSIAGYLSNYAGDDGLRQSIEEVIHNKEYLMQEFMLRVSSAKAYAFNLDQLESIDILGDH